MATPKHTPAKVWTAASEVANRLASNLIVNLNSGAVDHRMRLLLKTEPWRYEDRDGVQHAGSKLPEDVLMSPERSHFEWGKSQGFQVRRDTHTVESGWIPRKTRVRTELRPIPGTEMYRIEVLALPAPVDTHPGDGASATITTPPTRKGAKGYDAADWERLQMKCFAILITDDVRLGTPASVRDTAGRLRTWGKKHLGSERTPGSTQMREQVKVWVAQYTKALPLDD